jgi:hypothetical protein
MRERSSKPIASSLPEGARVTAPPLMLLIFWYTFESRPVKKSKTLSIWKLEPVRGSTVEA